MAAKAEGEAADVYYQDSWTDGLFTRRAKLDWLISQADAGTQPNAVPVERGLLDDMRPMPFLNGELISLRECFSFSRSGLQTKRDDLVYDPSIARLSDRIRGFLSDGDDDARETFHDTRDRDWVAARAVPFDEGHVSYIAYRPLDKRYLYNHRAYGDFLRPELQEVWGNKNVGLYALPSGTGAGPAVWCHGLLPDYHAFRGSYGGYAFPLQDRRPDVDASNITTALIERLNVAYGEPVSADHVFDTILCLLSATSYTLRFAEDIEDVFPHVPFPAHLAIFQNAGADFRASAGRGLSPAGLC
jgi:predicted helicase